MKNMNILAKLLTFLITTLVISFTVIYLIFNYSFNRYSDFVLENSEKLLTEKYRYMLQSNTEVAVTLLAAINSMENLSKEEKLVLARELVRKLRFAQDGYYFVYEEGTGINLIHGADKKLEGKNLWNLQDPDQSQYIIRELDRVAKQKEIFHEYYWPKPGTDRLYPKLGTAMIIPGTDMWIGTGAYIDDINSSKLELKANIEQITRDTRLKFLIGFLAIAPFAIILIVILSKTLTNPIKHLISSTEAISFGNYNVKIDARTHDEIGKLARTFNSMAVKLKDLTENLENKVDERTHELQETMNKLNETNSILESLSGKLSKYLSPQIREMLFTGKQEAEIASTRKKLTVFFSDIKNFTQTTERMETESLTELLNSYLNEMSQIAIKHGATIDKFIGDAMLVFFGDPETRGEREDALASIAMALEMKSRLRQLQINWYEEGVAEPFHVRMGINTGYCTVGNFGSDARMDYTIIGSQVNLASRLESSADPDQILISHETYSLISHRYYCLEKEEMMVKGVSHPIKTYQVVDTHENLKNKHRLIEERSAGFNILIDLENIKDENKGRARRILSEALELLSEKGKAQARSAAADIIRAAVEEARKNPEMAGTEFEISTEGVDTDSDPGALTQLLRDLFLNSAFLSGGGKVNITAQQENGSVVIKVTDSGEWLDRESLKGLFDREQDRPAGSKGLSLYSVKIKTRELKGRISAGRNPEGGNIFILTLPC